MRTIERNHSQRSINKIKKGKKEWEVVLCITEVKINIYDMTGRDFVNPDKLLSLFVRTQVRQPRYPGHLNDGPQDVDEDDNS